MIQSRQYWKAGAAAEMLVQIDLTRFGLNVSKAGDGLPYDILCEKNGKVLRIQVKSTHQLKTKSSFAFRTSRRGDKTYSKNEADIFALVNPDGNIIYRRLEENNPSSIYIKKDVFSLCESERTKKECFIGLIEEQNDFTKDIKREKELHRAASMALDFFWNLESLSERILEKPELSPLSFFQVYFERTLKAYPKQFSDSLILTGGDAS